MALIPMYDAMGNITGWEEVGGGTAAPDSSATSAPGGPTAAATPPPNFFGTAAKPARTAGYFMADGFNGTSTQGPLAGTSGPKGVDATVRPSPAGDPAPGDTGGGSNGGGGYGESFVWPEFDPGPAFQAPPPFRYDEFRAPSLDEAKAEPGYEFARSEGLRGLQNNAASRGVARTGGTLKDLIGWGNRFAEQNYGNVFNRAGQTYDRNRSNAADAYQTNYGISRDVFDRGYQQRKDVFQPKQRAAELTFDDLYRRWKAELDANTSIATAGAGL